MSTGMALYRRLSLLAALLIAMPVFSQSTGCPPALPRDASPADEAYRDGHYENAENLYVQKILQQPHDSAAASSLIHTLLHEGKLSEAATRAEAAIGDAPHSAAALTDMAE